ncbi:MAG TPA: 2-C-methyl-D-erythritol 4-phosphate cytidylyltransferase [Solirubrobacterales bacterium]|nr:2-C-methyl-D-erythritol 4-phosphate cytidylyltransferase [Solirubrobacterales bacterium]
MAAAGSGERLGAGGPKALVEVAGRPLIDWSLEALRASGAVDAVVIAAPPGHERELERLAGQRAGSLGEPGAFHPIVVTGGATRAASVGLALAETPADAELCLVHDAARPLVVPTLIEALVDRLSAQPQAAGAIAAAPLTDTVKRADGDAVGETVDRSELWAAQTPQAFRTEILREAHSADSELVAAATDDAMLVERLGGRVLIEPAPPENLKVTTRADLLLAELMLRERSG